MYIYMRGEVGDKSQGSGVTYDRLKIDLTVCDQLVRLREVLIAFA